MLKALSLAVLLATVPAAISAAELEVKYQELQDAVTKKDAAQVKALAAETSKLAREVVAAPAPTTDEEKEAWTKRIEYAKDVDLYTEYALSATALGGPAATTVDLLSTLEQQNPKSKYLGDDYGAYFYALHQSGADAKIPAVADKALANFPDNDDALMIMADSAYSKKQTEKALNYSKRLVAALNKRAKPEGVAAADWERKKTTGLSTGYWTAGVIEAEKAQYFEADKDLRAALPLVASNESRKAFALFYLGMANYNLGKMTMKKTLVLEAVKFSQDAAAIKGPLSQQAWHNALVMKDEAAKMR